MQDFANQMFNNPILDRAKDDLHDLVIELTNRKDFQLAATFMDVNQLTLQLLELSENLMKDVENFSATHSAAEDVIGLTAVLGKRAIEANLVLIEEHPDLALAQYKNDLEARLGYLEMIQGFADEAGDDLPF